MQVQSALLSSARDASHAVALRMQVTIQAHAHSAWGSGAHHAGELYQCCRRAGEHAETEGVHHAVELRIAKRQCLRVTCVRRHLLTQLDGKSPESGRYCPAGTGHCVLSGNGLGVALK